MDRAPDKEKIQASNPTLGWADQIVFYHRSIANRILLLLTALQVVLIYYAVEKTSAPAVFSLLLVPCAVTAVVMAWWWTKIMYAEHVEMFTHSKKGAE